MSEYWVSTAKRYCDACKCYIGDNKPSIQNHEQGKRHQENVAKRVERIAKRGAEDYAKQLAYEEEMAKIEAAALDAVTSDGITLGEQDRKDYKAIVARQNEASHKTYYDVAEAEQNSSKPRDGVNSTAGASALHEIKTPDSTKGVPGGWVTVAVRDLPPKKEETDDAAEGKQSLEVGEIPLPPPEKRKRFAEKVVTLSSFDEGDATSSAREGRIVAGAEKVGFGFKRRAVNRGNMRQRANDDD